VTNPCRAFHWIDPAGGDFADTSNWNPQQVPGEGDTAIFDLANAGVTTVLVENAAVRRLIIKSGANTLKLTGTAGALGGSGEPALVISDGALLELDVGAKLFSASALVGRVLGESAVFVEGVNTLWTNGPESPIRIGDTARGVVFVRQGGFLDAQGGIDIGESEEAGDSALVVEGGGRVLTPEITLPKGGIEVRGSGLLPSSLTVKTLDVGPTGSVTVEDGGRVVADEMTIQSVVTISGVRNANGQTIPSTLDAGELVVGRLDAQLEIIDGALLKSQGIAVIGSDETLSFDPGIGSVSVSGSETTWEGESLEISGIELTELAVHGGGEVLMSDAVVLGLMPNTDVKVTISGAGSFLKSNLLNIGGDGNARLIIENGGLVESGRGLVGSFGASLSDSASGIVEIVGSSPFPSEWRVAGDCTVGEFLLSKILLSGLPGNSPEERGATLRVDGTLRIMRRGEIAGTGDVDVLRVVDNGRIPSVVNDGLISPGQSPGRIIIKGKYEQTPNGMIKMEVAGLSEGQFDVLEITGDAVLDGTVEVRFLDGYLPKRGDAVDFMQVSGAITGNFAQITFPELAPGFDAELSLGDDGKLRLTARNDAAPGAGTTIVPPRDLPTPRPLSRLCGGGICGAGAAYLLPAMMGGLAFLRRRFSRFASASRGAR